MKKKLVFEGEDVDIVVAALKTLEVESFQSSSLQHEVKKLLSKIKIGN